MKIKDVALIGGSMGLAYLCGVASGIVKTMGGSNEALKDKKLEISKVTWKVLKGETEVQVSELKDENEEES